MRVTTTYVPQFVCKYNIYIMYNTNYTNYTIKYIITLHKKLYKL
jgi:hypothetical protein